MLKVCVISSFHYEVDENCALWMLQCVVCGFHVLGQPIGPVFKRQEIQEENFLTLEGGTCRLSQNIVKELPLYAA